MMEQTNNLNNTTTYINNLYDNLSFVDLHFTSILSFLFLTTIVILAGIYCSIMKNSQEIINNWQIERCNPKVMPFAGIINKPSGQSILEYTANNFSYCVKDILSGNLDTAMRPFNINGLLDSAKNAYNNLDLSLNAFNSFFANKINAIVRCNFKQPCAESIIWRIGGDVAECLSKGNLNR
jgi:hypothetical protein